ncbi:uncharacterized protein LOC142588365 [Dermacentor variabilis]|uniref:uncharacterized protein LOC142588365 n=1 Tax=Dermacentor variabilis TaxID=34621 RepID=UPI003F5B6BB2
MALIYVFHLLCISVAPLVAYPHESQVNDTKDLLLPRSMHRNCWDVPPRIVPRCNGNAYAFRFRYDWYTGKCEEFDDCEASTTGFDTREECLNECNPADITNCKAKAPHARKACKANDVSTVGFYGYNPAKNKCMEYPHCSFITGDPFSSREKCYQTCNGSRPVVRTVASAELPRQQHVSGLSPKRTRPDATHGPERFFASYLTQAVLSHSLVFRLATSSNYARGTAASTTYCTTGLGPVGAHHRNDSGHKNPLLDADPPIYDHFFVKTARG